MFIDDDDDDDDDGDGDGDGDDDDDDDADGDGDGDGDGDDGGGHDDVDVDVERTRTGPYAVRSDVGHHVNHNANISNVYHVFSSYEEGGPTGGQIEVFGCKVTTSIHWDLGWSPGLGESNKPCILPTWPFWSIMIVGKMMLNQWIWRFSHRF